MPWQPLGDSAFLFETEQPLAVVERLKTASFPEVLDVVPSFDSVAVHFRPENGERISEWLESLGEPEKVTLNPTGALHEVPVLYDGEDLDDVAKQLGRSREALISEHAKILFTVAAVGFSPGFPYLTGLPEGWHLPRRSTPKQVKAGSVAIAGAQAGIYPDDSHGGWHVLGHTDHPLFEPEATPPARLQPGDQLRFVPCREVEPHQPAAEEVISDGPIEVLDAGPMTTIQDHGRHGHQSSGVSPGGTIDSLSAKVANAIVGNSPNAALLECPHQGPVLRFHEDTRVAFIGWKHPQAGQPVDIPAGRELDLRVPMRQPIGYLAIAGGIEVPAILGSHATDLRAGLGGYYGRALRKGDRLPVGLPSPAPLPGDWHVAWPCPNRLSGELTIRFLPGMQAGDFTVEARELFEASLYQTTSEIDRMGMRLDGPRPERSNTREMLSQPVVAGSIQVPPDGRPTVLLAERQTIGGYPQIGHVISADLRKLAQAWPGTLVRFQKVSLREARAAWHQQQRDLAFLHTGLKLRF